MELPAKIAAQRTLIENCGDDCSFVRDKSSRVTGTHIEAKNITEQRKMEADERRRIRQTLNEAVLKNEYQHGERTLMTYRGFGIVLPSGMERAKPFVWLVRRGRYRVELSLSDVGDLTRIDNRIEGLEGQREKFANGVEKMLQRERDIEEELSQTQDYVTNIAACKERLSVLDRKLGVEEK